MYLVLNAKGKKDVGVKLKAMRFVQVLQGKTRITEQKWSPVAPLLTASGPFCLPLIWSPMRSSADIKGSFDLICRAGS